MAREGPLPEEEEELLVVAADGKSVRMRHTLEQRYGLPECSTRRSRRKQREEQASERATKRLGPGHGKVHKQMAFVGAVYSVARWRRTADEITNELLRKESEQSRPSPRNKRVHAEMTHLREGERVNGRLHLFVTLARDLLARDPDKKKPLVCLMDGQRALWDAQQEWLSRAVCIVDIFHVMEYLWKAAYCFHKASSRQAEQLVEHYLKMLLEGKVSSVIGGLRRRGRKLSPAKLKELNKVLTYLNNNKRHMKYNEYLEEGYPIGSGAVEGACRHLVSDRMECTGMRWELEGARAMLHTRSAFINGEWDDLIEHRIQNEQKQLYGQNAVAC